MAVKYKVFSDSVSNKRYLSPDPKLILKLEPNAKLAEVPNIKTCKTIDYILLHKASGNVLDLVDITSEQDTIEKTLKKYSSNTIKKQNNINHLLRDISIEELSQDVVEWVNKIDEEFEFLPIPFGTLVSENVNTNKEGTLLKEHLNYYLEKLGLKKIKNISDIDCYNLSSLGDGYFSIELKSKYKLLDKSHSNLIYSNEMQKFCLMSLGFLEFINCTTHLAGTFFETIFFIAKIQNRNDVIIKLINPIIEYFEWEEMTMPIFED